MLRDDDEEEAALAGGSVFLGVTAAFLLAELGDKTSLATAALASTQQAMPTWLGATFGMTAASGITILVGSWLGARLPPRVTRLAGVLAFAVIGVLLVVEGWTTPAV